MLKNRYFYVELGSKKSRRRGLENGLPLSCAILLQYLHKLPSKDDLAVAAHDNNFSIVEERLSNALNELTPYYEENSLYENPSKTQVFALHLRN